jgi:hypothetical protein
MTLSTFCCRLFESSVFGGCAGHRAPRFRGQLISVKGMSHLASGAWDSIHVTDGPARWFCQIPLEVILTGPLVPAVVETPRQGVHVNSDSCFPRCRTRRLVGSRRRSWSGQPLFEDLPAELLNEIA